MAATLTDEARELGKAYIERLLKEWKASKDDRKNLLATNTTLKSCAVVRLRRRLVRTLRDTCWQDHWQRPENFLMDCAESSLPAALQGLPKLWYRLSTTNIADLLNVHYMTVIGLLKPKQTLGEEIIDGLRELTQQTNPLTSPQSEG